MARADAGVDRYTRVAIWLHWTIGALIIVNLVLGIGHDAMKGFPAIPIHKSIGLTVLALSLVRLAWRLGHPAPPLPADVPRWQALSAHALHWGFYLLMLALPLSGWAMSSGGAKRYPLDWFGLFPVPYLPIPQGSPIGGVAHEAHEILGYVWIALLVLHVAAALKHHFVDRDTVLLRIAPALRMR